MKKGGGQCPLDIQKLEEGGGGYGGYPAPSLAFFFQKFNKRRVKAKRNNEARNKKQLLATSVEDPPDVIKESIFIQTKYRQRKH